jgi:hypothetical protein
MNVKLVKMQVTVTYKSEEDAKLSAQLDAAEAVKKALPESAGFVDVELKSAVIEKPAKA